MSSAPRGLAPREGLELGMMKMGRAGPLPEPRRRPQAGKSRDPHSQNADKYHEGLFLCGTPNKRHILLCKIIERCSNGAKISHKMPIDTSESKKTPHLCDHFGLRPTLNSFNLGFINSIPYGVTT